MVRNPQTIDRIVGQPGCRCLVSLTRVMSFSRDEEITANCLKVIRYCLKEEKNLQKTILEFPDMINLLIVDSFAHFPASDIITSEMKNILQYFTRKSEYMYLIKPDSLQQICQHESGIIGDFEELNQLSLSYLNSTKI